MTAESHDCIGHASIDAVGNAKLLTRRRPRRGYLVTKLDSKKLGETPSLKRSYFPTKFLGPGPLGYKKVLIQVLKLKAGNNRGFTAVELLLAITLGGLIIGFGYNGYRFFQKNFIQWQERVRVEETGRRLMEGLVNRVKTAREVVEANRHRISFIDSERRIVTYEMTNQAVLKNGRRIIDQRLIAKRLRFIYSTKSNRSLEDPANPKNIRWIQIHLVLSNQRKTSFELISSVSLRNKKGAMT